MRKIIGIAATAVLVCGALPSAQEPPGRGRGGFPEPRPGFPIDIQRVEPLELFEPVSDAPFSAETLTEVVQQLADGNRIEQRTRGSIARNSRGRIREERPVAGLPTGGRDDARIVTITDPARREQYRLDETRKIAWRLQLRPPPPRRDGAGVRPPPPPPRQPMKTEPLDPIQFDGVRAEGTRAIMVVPPGAIGNERAIEVVSERWYSPDLRVVVATKRTDPRFGDISYKLVNIIRAEPPAHLFEVPGDFTVRDQLPFPPPR